MIITGVDLITSGSDMNQMLPMHEQHQERYARVPEQWLTDGGFAKHDQIEQLEAHATKVFAPVVAPKDKPRDRYAAQLYWPCMGAWNTGLRRDQDHGPAPSPGVAAGADEAISVRAST